MAVPREAGPEQGIDASDGDGPTEASPSAAGRGRDPSAVWAARVFWAAAVVAVPIIVYQGRDQWFFWDEWDFLASRELTVPGALARPHNEHWTTLPVIVYRLLFRAVGLHHYWPYQAVAIGAHLGMAALLRAVMVRSRTDPWVATALAGSLLVLGSGATNITWGFQIAFTGALVLGLAQMLLADHEGRLGARDALGLVAGLGALMCSGVGVAMVVGVGVAVLLRRGWKAAAFHTVPLGAVFAVWYLRFEPVTNSAVNPREMASFLREMVSNAFVQLGRSGLWAVVLGVLVVAGVALAVRRRRPRGVRDVILLARSVPPLVAGTLVAGSVFALSTAVGRAGLGSLAMPDASRYVYMVVAFALPVVGVSVSQLVDGRRWARVAVVVFLLLGVPGNVRALEPSGVAVFQSGNEAFWREAAAMAADGGYPRSSRPEPSLADEVTMGWLADEVDRGRIDPASTVSPAVRGNVDLATSLEVEPAPRKGTCDRRTTARPVTVGRGAQLRLRTPQATVSGGRRGSPPGSLLLLEGNDLVLTARRGPLDLSISVPPGTDDTLVVCRPA